MKKVETARELVTCTDKDAIKLVDDIDLTTLNRSYTNIFNHFSGTLDGNGYSIKSYVVRDFITGGLIDIVTDEGTVRDLEVNSTVEVSSDIAGGVVGINRGQIENVTVTTVIAGQGKVGGITGVNYGIIRDCTVEEGCIYYTDCAGEIAGKDSGDIFKTSTTIQLKQK